MSFPSQQQISIEHQRMVDPFKGGMNVGVYLPTLKEFLEITKISQYASKFKKLKCVETDDVIKVLSRVGLKHVEEQRVRRYLDHFHQHRLKQPKKMEQPISLEEFFRVCQLTQVLKPIKTLGVVEFDDLMWIQYAQLSGMIPKNVEYTRFKRYVDRFEKSRNVDNTRVEPENIDLKSFLQEATLKGYKSTLEKLGVAEGVDLLSVNRSDLQKMPQVEYDRFLRHRQNKFGHLAPRRDSVDRVPDRRFSTNSLPNPSNSQTSLPKRAQSHNQNQPHMMRGNTIDVQPRFPSNPNSPIGYQQNDQPVFFDHQPMHSPPPLLQHPPYPTAPLQAHHRQHAVMPQAPYNPNMYPPHPKSPPY